MITSRLGKRARTTIPRPVRAALGLQPGDELRYRIEAGRVIVTRLERPRPEDPFGTFVEWAGEADRKGYAEL